VARSAMTCHDGEVVLVAAHGAALGREHADDGVIDAVDFELLAEGGSEGENRFGQRIAQHADTALVFHVAVVKKPALVNDPIVRRETAGGVAEQLDVGRGLGVTGRDLAGEKSALDADGGGERGPFGDGLSLFDHIAVRIEFHYPNCRGFIAI